MTADRSASIRSTLRMRPVICWSDIAFTGVGSYNKSDTELAFYGQDHWILNPRLSVDLGAAY